MGMKAIVVTALLVSCGLACAGTETSQEPDLAAPERAFAGATWLPDDSTNYAAVAQTGDGNFASIVQTGTSNRASIQQGSNADWASVVQIGSSNLARIRQMAR